MRDNQPLATRPTFHIERQLQAGRCVLRLVGVLDVNTSADLRAELSAVLAGHPLPEAVEIRLDDVTFVDSMGLGTLVVGRRICAHAGVPLTVSNSSAAVARMIAAAGFGARLAGAGTNAAARR